jgi:hypothetical protein
MFRRKKLVEKSYVEIRTHAFGTIKSVKDTAKNIKRLRDNIIENKYQNIWFIEGMGKKTTYIPDGVAKNSIIIFHIKE